MSRGSIFFKLNLLFFVAISSTLIAFIFALEHQYMKEREEIVKNLKILIQEYRHKREFSKDILKLLNASLINSGEIGKIISSGRVIDSNFRLNVDGLKVKLIEYKGEIYFFIEDSKKISMLFIREDKRYIILITTLFFAVISFLLVIYLIIRRNLKPLKMLEQEIKSYSFGNSVNLKFLDSDNEVAKINNAFLEFSKRAKALQNSRDLFIKNIFHELNTPVTKGKILAEITEDESLKPILKSIFDRLSRLLSELSKIEQIASKNYHLEVKEVPLIELIEEAKKLLFLTDIRHNITNETVEVDPKSMVIVFKNLIDNGLKYGKNFYIEYSDGRICFISEGNELKDLSHHLEPFSTTSNNPSSMGLGLFIVKEILLLHNRDLIYIYRDNKNHFCITLK